MGRPPDPVQLAIVVVIGASLGAGACTPAVYCESDADCPSSTRCAVRKIGQARMCVVLLSDEDPGAVAEREDLVEGEFRADDGDDPIVDDPGEGEGEGIVDDAGTGEFIDGFRHRRTITIRGERVHGYLFGFPALIVVEDPALADVSNGGHVMHANGADLSFRSVDGTVTLDHDLQRYVSETGRVVAWVRIPELDEGEDLTFALYYGRDEPVAVDTADTWQMYSSVYHLDADLDDRAGNRDGTSHGLDAEDNVDGLIGRGRQFLKGHSSISVPCWQLSGQGAATVSAWGRLDESGSGFPRLFHMGFAVDRAFELFVNDDAQGDVTARTASFRVDYPANWIWPLVPVSNLYGEWHHYAGVIDWTTQTLELYVDGELADYAFWDQPIPNDHYTCHIGNWDRSTFVDPRNWNGVIDEVRVSSLAMSPGWFQTEYENIADPTDFVDVGPDETAP